LTWDVQEPLLQFTLFRSRPCQFSIWGWCDLCSSNLSDNLLMCSNTSWCVLRAQGPQIAGAPANSKPSFVDDILSGLGSLSRAQVKGSKELPSNASKRPRPSWYQVSPLTNCLWAGCCAYEFVIIIGLCTIQHQVRCWHTVRHFVISILNWGGVWNGHKRFQRIASWVSIDGRMDSFCK
jgi:hypothetical protein